MLTQCMGCDECCETLPYVLTLPSGDTETVDYCEDCHDLALMDWSGEGCTVSSVEVAP